MESIAVHVEGVRIELTEDQVKKVVAARKEPEKCREDYGKMLQHFGFKKNLDIGNLGKDLDVSYSHPVYNWYAEIQHRSGTWFTCWLTGPRVRCSRSFPRGMGVGLAGGGRKRNYQGTCRISRI